MKKKSNLIILLCFTMIMMIVGCSKDQTAVNEQNSQEILTEQADGQETSNESEAETSESQGIGVEKNLLTVDITLPAAIAGDLADFNEEEYLSQNEGLKAAKVNEDGSLTITMTKSKHKEMVDEVQKSIDESFGELIEGEDTPYIKSIDYTDDYREVSIGVIKEEYENAFDFTPFIVGLSASMYQSMAGIDINTTVIIKDSATGVEINSVTYPDAWNKE